jgi:hypothetical protein
MASRQNGNVSASGLRINRKRRFHSTGHCFRCWLSLSAKAPLVWHPK